MLIILFLSVLNSYKSVPHECPYSYKSSLCVGVTVLPVLAIWSHIAQPCLRYFPECFFMVRLYRQIDPGLVPVLSFCDVCVRVTVAGLVACCPCYTGFPIRWHCGSLSSCAWSQLGPCYSISCTCTAGSDDIDLGCLASFI